jgi:hypothetical protein
LSPIALVFENLFNADALQLSRPFDFLLFSLFVTGAMFQVLRIIIRPPGSLRLECVVISLWKNALTTVVL